MVGRAQGFESPHLHQLCSAWVDQPCGPRDYRLTARPVIDGLHADLSADEPSALWNRSSLA